MKLSRNSLAGWRMRGDGTASSTRADNVDIPVDRFDNPVSKRGCHSSPTATSWTKQVHIKMLEQTLINHTCNLVLWITCPPCNATLSLSCLACPKMSDLTSIFFFVVPHCRWFFIPKIIRNKSQVALFTQIAAYPLEKIQDWWCPTIKILNKM